jgi:5-(carboxyamino)imidazole ribonucleotide mutase
VGLILCAGARADRRGWRRGKLGAANAALFAAEILALNDEALYERLTAWFVARAQEMLDSKLPE